MEGAGPGPSVPAPPRPQSEDDILMMTREGWKKVHVHGEMARHEVHPPQHAPQDAQHVAYAKAAREEMHDVAVHPPPVKLMSGKATGVEQWDKVNSPKAH